MCQLELSREEAEWIRELFADSLSDLRLEIMHTDRRDYRATLKTREALLTRLLQRLDEEILRAPAENEVAGLARRSG